MMINVAKPGEDTTAYAVGTLLGQLYSLRRMIELNNPGDASPVFSKKEIMHQLHSAIMTLNSDAFRYPFKA